ncbi:hypothetical protein DMM05_19675 [Salmonella enterica subsp. houtenae]|nr:hypothetical protein [Salmonella enterica subsp. houtenae]
MATIKDVASLAGVSTATVSRVINQTAWVEPVTRERVEKAMRDLNYRRNAAAIALAKRSGDMLGLLTGNLADPFFARLARGVEDVSRKQQYRLMVCSGGHDEEMEKAGLDFLVNQGCEVATPQRVTDIIHSLESLYHFNIVLILPPVIVLWGAIRKKPVIPLMLSACVFALFLGVIMQGLSIKQGLDAFIDGFDIAMFPQGAEGVVADVPRLLNRGGMFSMMGTILLVFCAFSFAGALTLTGALTIIINRLLTIIHSVGQLIAATIGTTILVTGATSDGKLALLVPAELFKDAYRRMGLDTKNLSRTIEDAGTVIEPLLPWTSAGVYMATTLGVSTLDLLPWAIQCYAAIFFALIYGFSGVGIARTAPASEKSPQSSVTE